ncbi:MAG: phosphate signaling complex protein PhoU [Bacteroidota bacterium]
MFEKNIQETHNDMHRSFEDDLDKVRTRLIRMGSLVEEQVEFAFRSLLECNLPLAEIVIERDDKVDKLDLKIDKHCQRLFALHQPVASDLRLLLAALKINNELERIGDTAVDVARVCLSVPTCRDLSDNLALERITKATFIMVKASLDAFINNDLALAKQILPTDDTVDNLEKEITRELVVMMQHDSKIIEPGVKIISALRSIERMADHATNIAENVIFLFEAKLVRHRHIDEDEGLEGLPLSDDGEGEM